jgi:hypothetical protein
MINCSKCGKEFTDDTKTLTCDRCGSVLPQAAGSEIASALPKQDSKPEAVKINPALVTKSVPRRPESKEEVLDPNHLDAVSAYGKKSIVSVIGFSNSGKTFFVNRLRDLLSEKGWHCTPASQDKIDKSPEGIELSRFVPVNQGGRRDHSFLMVDCAGESFRQAFESQWKEGMLERVNTRSYLTALGLASAYVLVIRAEDLVRQQSGGDLVPMLKTFYDILNGITVAKEKLQQQSPKDFLAQGISKADLDAAANRTSRHYRQPIAVVFSLADRIEEMAGDNGSYDSDPFLFARYRANKLFQAITNTFTYHRFDFLSAFYKHDNSTQVDYSLPSYGTAAIFNWLTGLLSPSIPLLGGPLRVARGRIPTSSATFLRKLVDPEFRRERSR